MRRFLYEADDDNTTGGENNNAAENNDAAADNNNNDQNDDNKTDDNNQEDQNQDDNQEDENNQDENQDDNTDEEDDDFGINDDDNGEDDENTDEGGEDNTADSEETSNLDQNSLKAKDRELFDSLSIPEQQIKVKELKNQFGELYGNCLSIIDRLNNISLELNDEYPQLKRLNEILYNLKDTISFYILNIYDIKSYFENDIIFNRYLAILNGVKTVLNTVKNGINNDK